MKLPNVQKADYMEVDFGVPLFDFSHGIGVDIEQTVNDVQFF